MYHLVNERLVVFSGYEVSVWVLSPVMCLQFVMLSHNCLSWNHREEHRLYIHCTLIFISVFLLDSHVTKVVSRFVESCITHNIVRFQ